jgi:molybdate transport system ATP-binding protein
MSPAETTTAASSAHVSAPPVEGSARGAHLHVRLGVAQKDGFALDVEFDAPPGITIFFGPSGSGKSTTLAAIAGLIAPTSGRIALGDEVWFDSAAGIDRPIHRRGVAFVFQSLALFPHLTAARNVAYGMDRETPRKDRRARSLAMLERWKVGHLADRRPPTFSGGEAQRVALARAFAMSPRIVLLDEPFSAMDRRLRYDLSAEVRSFVDELKIPMIHVTHHRNEARALADRVVLLDRGRVIATGPGSELLRDRPGTEDMSFDDTPMMMATRGAKGERP